MRRERNQTEAATGLGHHTAAAITLLTALLLLCANDSALAQMLPDSTRFRPEAHVLLAEGSLATLPPAEVRRWQVGLLRADRIQHASASFTLAAGVGIATENRASAIGFSLGLGLLKECWDARAGRFDVVDLTADLYGALLGGLTATSH